MIDFIVDGTILESNLAKESYDYNKFARFLHLASPRMADVPWSKTKVQDYLPEYGFMLFRLLETSFLQNAKFPNFELIPPASTNHSLPYRVWLPESRSGNIPWEACSDEYGNQIFGNGRASLLRFYDGFGAKPPPPFLSLQKLSILIATSMPQNAPSANIDLQHQEIRFIDRLLRQQGRQFFTWFEGGNLEKLRNQVIKDDINAVHIIAHGAPGKILWQKYDQSPVWYSTEDFAHYFEGLDLDFVVMTVCDSATHIVKNDSLISGLIKVGVRAAIGMHARLDDVAAAAFSSGFYRALMGTSTVLLETLISEGRSAILKAIQRQATILASQWALPILLLKKSSVLLSCEVELNSSKTSKNEQDINLSKIPPSSTGISTNYALVIIKSPEQELHRIILKKPSVWIGKSDKADIILKGRHVCPFHACIRQIAERQYEIVDESGTEKTYVNDIAIDKARLKDQDVITIDQFKITFCMNGNANDGNS